MSTLTFNKLNYLEKQKNCLCIELFSRKVQLAMAPRGGRLKEGEVQEKVRITVGFVSSRRLDPTEADEDESEDEDDDDDFDFSTGGLKTRRPDKRIVEMKILNNNSCVHVKCRLPWTWSWLQVKKWRTVSTELSTAGHH